jgi:hypothetical protein
MNMAVTSTDLLTLALNIRGAGALGITELFVKFDELNPDWGTIPLTAEELVVFNRLQETRDAAMALAVLDSVMLPVADRLGLRRTDLAQAARNIHDQ